ncbi:MAG: hypothetical protein OHK0045_17230 [Raineya sp.]
MLISFFPKTDTCYLFDFGTLAEHFQEHQKQENIDFWQFLWLHYAHTEHQNQDHKHKNLPLQHHHAECVSVVVQPTITLEVRKQYLPAIQVQNYIYWQSFYQFQLTNENFQPPRA